MRYIHVLHNARVIHTHLSVMGELHTRNRRLGEEIHLALPDIPGELKPCKHIWLVLQHKRSPCPELCRVTQANRVPVRRRDRRAKEGGASGLGLLAWWWLPLISLSPAGNQVNQDGREPRSCLKRLHRLSQCGGLLWQTEPVEERHAGGKRTLLGKARLRRWLGFGSRLLGGGFVSLNNSEYT